MNISAIILAGGNSKRMKYDKEFIKVGDEFLVHKQIKKLRTVFEEIIIVSNNPKHYDGLNVKVVKDILVGKSPIIGLHAGLINSRNKFNYCIACDMAYINLEFINYLVGLIDNQDAYVGRHHNYIEPFNAIYSKNIIPIIESFIEKKSFGFQRLVKSVNTHYINDKKVNFYQQEYDMYKNINSEKDLYSDTMKIPSSYQQIQIEKIINDDTFNVTDKVITEYPLSIFVNGNHYSTIMMTPDDVEFLIIGYLYGECVIKKLNEIEEFKLDLENHRCDVKIDHDVKINNTQRLNIMSTACGNSKMSELEIVDLPIIPLKQKFQIGKIFDEVLRFNRESILFKETGGVHSVQLIYNDNKVLFEDIGRHNAVDKVVGYLLKNKINRDDVYIITSGRISSDILLKAALMNISLIVSRSAPTSLAVKLAGKLGVTVIGFARGNKMNIYSHKERITRISCLDKISKKDLYGFELIINKFKDVTTPLIPIMYEAENLFGYIPHEIESLISNKLGISIAKINGVATFYSRFHTHPTGKHHIGVCTGTSCHLNGSDRILKHLERKLYIKEGETTSDGQFTIVPIRCTGNCDKGPNLTVDGKVYHKVTNSDVFEIIKLYSE